MLDGVCVQGSQEDCSQSVACAEQGYCTFCDSCLSIGWCYDGLDSDPLSIGCLDYGCLIASEADCKQSKKCKEHGYCKFDREYPGEHGWRGVCEK